MAKGTYVDGFVIAIPKKNTAKYKAMAKEGLTIWKKFGALDYKECIFDQTPPQVSLTFKKLINAKPTETVWFSFVTYKSKAHRDAVNKKVMAYFAKKYSDADLMNMPFDMKRMATGGFKVVVGI